MHGGDLVAEVLKAQGVPFLFTLCGGHISPILVGCKQRGIRVIDTRHEATAVFAADAVARLTGRPGVAAVTAGPGVTNAVTAIKNAQMAQSAVILIGGAAPTALRGRGALQDIDQMSLMRSLVKWATRVGAVRDLVPGLEKAFEVAQRDVPGPVFVECPIDLLYDEALVRDWYGIKTPGRGLASRVVQGYLKWHVNRLFAGAQNAQVGPKIEVAAPVPNLAQTRRVAEHLQRAQRPLLLVGSQATLRAGEIDQVASAVEHLGIPVYLAGMARGLLGRQHPLQMRHKRRQALKEADFVLLAGVPCDFRLDYGRAIRHSTVYVSANRSRADLNKNRRPNIGVLADPGLFLCQLAGVLPPANRWEGWCSQLRERDEAQAADIARQMREPAAPVNPLYLLGELDKTLAPKTILVADGGDFVGTASYIVNPTGPLTWLDPGAFGTLGVGAGFALGAKLVHPEAEVWILYGDGSVGYSLAEFDTDVRHGIPIMALVGNDAGWTQIARDQVEMLGDNVGTVLARSDYHRVVEGFGAAGLMTADPELVPDVLKQAQALASEGKPVLINVHVGQTNFRKGSISM